MFWVSTPFPIYFCLRLWHLLVISFHNMNTCQLDSSFNNSSPRENNYNTTSTGLNWIIIASFNKTRGFADLASFEMWISLAMLHLRKADSFALPTLNININMFLLSAEDQYWSIHVHGWYNYQLTCWVLLPTSPFCIPEAFNNKRFSVSMYQR